ncbi:MAG: pyridoxamine 5'-phosphate oxidase family protein [Ilumatobacteraceae bacterium]
MEIDRYGFEVLDEDQCRELLQSVSVGRVALTSGALPVIVPVVFVMFGNDILFESSSDLPLDAAARGSVACFEADEGDSLRHGGWSVLATGQLELLRGTPAFGAPLFNAPTFAAGFCDTGFAGSLVRMRPEMISGRRPVDVSTIVHLVPTTVQM